MSAPTMVPLVVRAELAGGVAVAGPWAPALDGILAAEVWADRKALAIAEGRYTVRALQQPYPPDMEVPLARCPLASGEQWHWLATCGMPVQSAGPTQVHSWSGRVDARDLEQTSAVLPKVVSSRQGRFQSRRMPLLVTICQSMVWRAVGDLDAIAELLAGIESVGKKRSSGNGRVLRWSVHPDPLVTHLEAGHLHPDGSLGRPTPQVCLDGLHVGTTGGYGTAGVRPPYMHRSRQQALHLPALLDAP